jgi:hypothetical protein
LSHGDHEGGREEDADLAEVDLFVGVVVVRRAQDDQPQILLVARDLRSAVSGQCVLHRQLVQPEQLADLSQLLSVGLEQAQPHEPALGPQGRRLRQWHRSHTVPAAVLVVSTVDDHVDRSSSRIRALIVHGEEPPARTGPRTRRQRMVSHGHA